MRDLGGLLRLIRPVNCIMMGFAILVGAAIGGGATIIASWRDLILGSTTGFTLTGSAMAVNDYYDREIDAVNEPKRPIPSGAITPSEALTFSLVLTSIGLISAWITSLSCLAVAVFSWAITVLYVTRGKKTGFLGNLLVSTCIATTFFYGGLAVERTISFSSILFALIAFLSNTGREVTKGIVDVEGDRAKKVRTVAVARSARTAAVVAATFYLSATAISFLPIYFNLVSVWYVPFVALTDLGLIYSSYSVIRDSGRENSRRVKNHVLIWMSSGLVGFLVGSFL